MPVEIRTVYTPNKTQRAVKVPAKEEVTTKERKGNSPHLHQAEKRTILKTGTDRQNQRMGLKPLVLRMYRKTKTGILASMNEWQALQSSSRFR